MSHNFIPVQWNTQKKFYDLILLGAIGLYVAVFMGIGLMVGAADPMILCLRALGTCAFVLLHIILTIGPLSRLSERFKPLLYNRRHFGVVTALLGLSHASLALIWYHGDGVLDPLVSAIGGYGDYGVAIEFPFESLGLGALLILLVMAATSHDFWLAWLTPPLWKGLHMSVYLAYGLLVGHVAFGAAQFDKSGGLLWSLVVGVLVISLLHVLAFRKGQSLDVQEEREGEWLCVGAVADIEMNRAVSVTPSGGGQRIAVFRHAKGLSAIVGVCSHQNGPLAEGCVIDGLITCPWHGFQFDPETGAAPPPFTDKVQTHELKIRNAKVWVRAIPDEWGVSRKAVVVSS